MKPSPGPWTADCQECRVHDKLGRQIAIVGGDGYNADYNTRLMAAAPEFLTQAERILQMADEVVNKGNMSKALDAGVNVSELLALRDIIKKAKGETDAY
jgi:hypothetical protein